MKETVWTAVIGGIAGLVTGAVSSLVAPWINWGIEKQRERYRYRQQMIREWRQMVVDVRAEYESGQRDGLFLLLLEKQPGYISFSQHLSKGEKESLRKAQGDLNAVKIVMVAKHTNLINPIDDFVERLSYQIRKIEEEWDLI